MQPTLADTPRSRPMARRLTHRAVCCAGLLCVLLCFPDFADAKPQTFTATHTYVMGHNDSRIDARRICLMEAKRDILEQAGTWVTGLTSARNFELTSDQVRSLAAGFVQVNVIDESIAALEDTFALTMTVEAVLDPEEIKQTLARMAQDLDQLSPPADEPPGRPREPAASSGTQAPFSGHGPALSPDRARRAALDLGKGAPLQEALDTMGDPLSVRTHDAPAGAYLCLDYRSAWTVFRDGRLACARTELEFNSSYGTDCHCSGSGRTFLFR